MERLLKSVNRLLLRKQFASRDLPERKAESLDTFEGTIYAIGDVHGRLDLLLKLEAMIQADMAQQQPTDSMLIMLGDYIDRGPDSRGVVNHLTSVQSICRRRIYLKGNHEQFLLDFLRDPAVLDDWSNLGGLDTLRSYRVKTTGTASLRAPEVVQAELRASIPDDHLAFLQSLALSYETPTHFFSHAGVNPSRSLSRQTPEDLMWIRGKFLTHRGSYGKIVVHGHTPRPEPECLHNRIGIDTAAFATGRLTCAVLDGSACRFMTT
jgi:serine/threonine protein phosphatase 1